MHRRRIIQTVAASTLGISAGCTAITASDDDTGNSNGEPAGSDEKNTADTENEDNEITEPTTTLQFGEQYTDGDLELTVTAPTFESSVSTSEEVFEFSDERGVALVPVVFFNRSNEEKWLYAPTFTLTDGDIAVEEANRITLDDESTVRTRELFGVERDSRWNSHGTGIDTNTAFTTTAVFEIPGDIETSELRILFEPVGGMDDDFEDEYIAWVSP